MLALSLDAIRIFVRASLVDRITPFPALLSFRSPSILAIFVLTLAFDLALMISLDLLVELKLLVSRRRHGFDLLLALFCQVDFLLFLVGSLLALLLVLALLAEHRIWRRLALNCL